MNQLDPLIENLEYSHGLSGVVYIFSDADVAYLLPDYYENISNVSFFASTTNILDKITSVTQELNLVPALEELRRVPLSLIEGDNLSMLSVSSDFMYSIMDSLMDEDINKKARKFNKKAFAPILREFSDKFIPA